MASRVKIIGLGQKFIRTQLVTIKEFSDRQIEAIAKEMKKEPDILAPKAETAAEEAKRHAKMTTGEVMAELGVVDDIQAEAQAEAEAMARGAPKAKITPAMEIGKEYIENQ